MAKNDLNMALGAKVVKLRVELDYKNSGLKRQVDNISKFLEKKPVKLKVELNITRKQIHEQMNSLNTRLSKFAKEVKIPVKLDAGKVSQGMNKEIQGIQRASKKMGEAIDKNFNVSTKTATVKGANYIKNYGKQLKEVESIMRSKTPDGKGIFSSHQYKDAKGNLLGFIATLERANGVSEKLRYTFNKDKNGFEIVKRTTMDNTQKFFEKLKRDLSGMEGNLSKAGSQTKKLTKEFETLTKMGDQGMLTRDMVNSFEKRLKSAKKLASVEENNKKTLEKQEALVTKIANMKKVKKASGYDEFNKSVKEANESLKKLEELSKKKLNADGVKKLETQYKNLNNTLSQLRVKEKEINAMNKEKARILNDLARMQRQSAIAGTALNNQTIKESKEQLKQVRSKEQLILAQKRYNDLLLIESQRSENTSRRKIIKSIIDAQGKLGHTVMNSKQITEKYTNSVEKLRQAEQKLTEQVRKRTEEQAKQQAKSRKIMDEAYKKSIVKKDNKGNDISSSQIEEAIRSQKAFKELVATVTKGEIATSKFTSNAKKGLQRMEVQLEGSGKKAKKLVYELDAVNGKLRRVAQNEVFNRNANLGMFEQLRIAMERVPTWMIAMGSFYGAIGGVRAMVNEILELDKALTELKRVASDNINIDVMLEGGLKVAKELGNNVMDVMNGISELARTFGDFNERQLLDITKTATLMANVSDLNAEEATQTLIGTMNAFNITASESIQIVDKLNEVDINQPPYTAMYM